MMKNFVLGLILVPMSFAIILEAIKTMTNSAYGLGVIGTGLVMLGISFAFSNFEGL